MNGVLYNKIDRNTHLLGIELNCAAIAKNTYDLKVFLRCTVYKPFHYNRELCMTTESASLFDRIRTWIVFKMQSIV